MWTTRLSAADMGSKAMLRPLANHPVGNAHGHCPQGVVASLSIFLDVEDDAGIHLACPFAHHEVDDELQGAQGFALAADEKARILPGDVDERAAGVGVVGGAQGSRSRCSRRMQNVSHDFHGCGGNAGIANAPDSYAGRLCAQPQKTGWLTVA